MNVKPLGNENAPAAEHSLYLRCLLSLSGERERERKARYPEFALLRPTKPAIPVKRGRRESGAERSIWFVCVRATVSFYCWSSSSSCGELIRRCAERRGERMGNRSCCLSSSSSSSGATHIQPPSLPLQCQSHFLPLPSRHLDPPPPSSSSSPV